MREYILVLMVAAAVTYLLSGAFRLLALRTDTLAQVRTRDVHSVAIPYFGGLAMFGGFSVALLLATHMPFLSRHPAVAHDAIAVMWAALIICVVGALDDKYDLPAMVKLGGQILAAAVAVMQGVRIFWIPLPGSIISLDNATSILVTLFFIVLCTNAINFADGLDGLAAGVVAIGAAAFFSYTYFLAVERGLARASSASLLTILTLGICIGFLFHNFNPARMFMGDSGALMLGLLMAMSGISLTGQIDSGVLTGNEGQILPALLPILLPFAALALPVGDLILAYIRRTWKGQYWFVADKQHLHHRLLARGHSHRGAVLLMYGWTAVVSLGLVFVAINQHAMAVWTVAGAILLILVLTIWPVAPSSSDSLVHNPVPEEPPVEAPASENADG